MEKVKFPFKLMSQHCSAADIRLKAPKYINSIDAAHGFIPQVLNKFKKIKVLKKICQIRTRHSNKEPAILQVLLQHHKTLKDIQYYTDNYRKDIMYYQKCIALDHCYLDILNSSTQNNFMTKVSIHNLYLNLGEPMLRGKQCVNLSRVAERLLRFKNLSRLLISIWSADLHEHDVKFLGMLNNLLPLISQRTKIYLSFRHKFHDLIRDLIQPFENIMQRITQVHFVDSDDLGSLISFLPTLKRLQSLKITARTTTENINIMLEDINEFLKTTLSLRVLDIKLIKRRQRTCDVPCEIMPFDVTHSLLNYSHLLCLEQINLDVPQLSFGDFEIKPHQKLALRANKVSLSGNVNDWGGLSNFLRILHPTTFKGSVLRLNIMDIKWRDDINELFKKLAGPIQFEKVVLMIDNRTRQHFYERDFEEFLIHITGPRELEIRVSGNGTCRIKDWQTRLILFALNRSQGKMRHILFSPCRCGSIMIEQVGGRYEVKTQDFDSYYGQECDKQHYYDQNENSSKDTEEEDSMKEVSEIKYFDVRHRPTERKEKKKLFTEYS